MSQKLNLIYTNIAGIKIGFKKNYNDKTDNNFHI